MTDGRSLSTIAYMYVLKTLCWFNIKYLDSFDGIFYLKYSSLWRECIDTPAYEACTRQ